MLKFFIPSKFFDIFNDNVLNKIASILYQSTNYEKTKIDKRNIGRYITLKNTDTDDIHYIVFSNPDNNARNARLMQYFTPVYKEYYFDTENKNKFLDVFILNPDSNDKTDYSKFCYRCFKTLNIKILNESELNLDNLNKFSNYYDFKHSRAKTSARNRGNKSTFFSNDENQISIYGKTFGANSMESFIFALVLKKLVSDRPIVFYPVVDNNATNLATHQRKILEDIGITYGTTIDEIDNNDVELREDTTPNRNTAKFHYNLLKKYGDKKCLLCGCELEHLIIGSHIERFADIKNNKSYSDDEKKQKIVDAENGFWLCANHDKMFEFGIIYFKDKTLKCAKTLSDNEKKFITHSLNLQENENIEKEFIKNIYFSDSMEKYLEKHRERIGVDKENE